MAGDVLVGRMERGRQVRRSAPAGRVLGAERRVAADLLACRLRVPEIVARRVDADHHGAVDALRVAPCVDHRRACPRALAEEIDLAVTECASGGVEVVDAFGKRVAGEVDAGALESVGAGLESGCDRAVRLLAQEIACVLPRRYDFSTVELRRAVDAAVADEHDVVPVREAARVLEVHVRETGPALEAEDRNTRLRRARADPLHRERDQPRARLVPVLANHERAAVGAVAAVLGRVVAGVELQLASVCRGRHGDRVVAGAGMEVGEGECGERDEREGDDSRWAETFGSRGFHRLSFRRVR